METVKKNGFYEMRPAEGMWLTQVDATVSERVFSELVCSPSDGGWEEWSDARKVAWEEEHPEGMDVTEEME